MFLLDRRADRSKKLAQYLRRMLWLERALMRQIATEFRKRYDSVADAIERDGSPAADVTLLGHEYTIRTMLRAHYARVVEEFGVRLFLALRAELAKRKAEDDETVYDRRMQEWIDGPATARIAGDISRHTREQIRRIIDRGNADGLGTAEIARMIRRIAPAVASYRAQTIARTETHNAAGYATDQAARELEIKMMREWVSVDDDRTRDEHNRANGQTVAMDEPFIFRDEAGGVLYTLMYPGDPAGPPEGTINCRCAVAFIPQQEQG